MKLREMGFRDYYHNYVVLEADALTEECSKTVSVKEQDCFLLCSSYINRSGHLRFNVLSIGHHWNECRKGLGKEQMLGDFAPEQLAGMEARPVEPDDRMIEKNSAFLEENYRNVPEKLMETRANPDIDEIRDDFYPDIVQAGFVEESSIREYPMRLCRFNGPFAEGILLEDAGPGRLAGTVLRTLPYAEGRRRQQRLLVVFSGMMNEEEKKMYEHLKERGTEVGFGFSESDHRRKN
ncbi:MAG: hypothetical protein IKD66_10765 [Solobacterium sp.]|nr:hypothetical protein [Solobacterium sp.]